MIANLAVALVFFTSLWWMCRSVLRFELAQADHRPGGGWAALLSSLTFIVVGVLATAWSSAAGHG